MASPCAVLVETTDSALGLKIGDLVKAEALRIEAKYSRYRPSVITDINTRAGQSVELDAESADLIDYAAQCFQISAGKFDITSGILRHAWKYGEHEKPPTQNQVRAVLNYVGWQRVSWNRPHLKLAAGMEIDLGGIGKEYAVDRALTLAKQHTEVAVLVNLGGDLRVSGPRRGSPWQVAIENVDKTGTAAGILELASGAIATSGDTYRRVIQSGVRYGHVLDPQSGWPVPMHHVR